MILTAKDKSEYRRKLFQVVDEVEFPVVVNIEHGDIRSIQANKRYWAGLVSAIQRHFERIGLRYSKEGIHLYLKIERYGKKAEVINGKVIEREARSSKMTPRQFAKFMDWAEVHAISELGVDPLEIDNYHEVSV